MPGPNPTDPTPTLLYFSRPIIDGSVEAGVVSSQSTATLLGSSFGAQSGKGAVGLVALDCSGSPAKGVQFTISAADAMTKVIYFKGNLPDTSLTETDATVILNVPPASPPTTATVTARIAATSQKIGAYEIFIRADRVTVKYCEPTP